MEKSDFIKKASNVHGDKYNYSLVNYTNNTTKIIIICEKHNKFSQIPKNHLKGHGCPKCAVEYKSKNLRKNTSDLVEEFIKVHNDKYDYSLIKYKNTHTKIDINCPTHGKFQLSPSHHLNGIGCSKCSGCYHRNTQELIEELNKIHDKKYTYILDNYKNIKDKILIVCDIHGEFNQYITHHLSGHGCPDCYISKGEYKIEKFLKENHLSFIKEKTFNGCLSLKSNKLRFDFYLPKYNILIEYDGIQHFKPVEYFGGEKYLKETKINDNIKDKFCIENNIKLHRISYNQKLNKKLNKIKEEMKNT